jgi:hypothetical protein
MSKRIYTDEHRAYARAYAQIHKQQRLEYAKEYYKTHDRKQYYRDRRARLALLKPPKSPNVITLQKEVKPLFVKPSSIGIFKKKPTYFLPILSIDPTKTSQSPL